MKEVAAYYALMKTQPINEAWVALDTDFRHLLFDEVNRITNGFNYQLDKDAEPKIRLLLSALKACLDKDDCIAPALSAADKAFLATQIRYTVELSEVETANTTEEKGSELKNLIK